MRAAFVILLLILSLFAGAQVYPHKVTLNHLQVMFEYPQVKNADVYKICIENAINRGAKIVYEGTDSSTAHLVDGVLRFGNAYNWQYLAYCKGKKIYTSPGYSFSTINTPVEKIFKANVTVYDTAKVLPGLIFFDQGIVIDRKGNLVLVSDSFGVEKRDFSLTQNGSITYVQNTNAFDRTLNGDIIWQSKKLSYGDALVYGYHHDVTKLANGNYLVMCRVKEKDTLQFKKNLDEAIVEVDGSNTIKWFWKEDNFIPDTSKIKTTHSNSIFLDEKENKIYVSARDINTIFTINRASGKIEKCIGYNMAPGAEHYPQAWFAGQHSAQLLPSGNILLFNNNARPPAPGLSSSILEINNPTKSKPEVSPLFFYIYDFGRGENHCAKGGDVNKLKNNNYLISSSAYNRNFELSAASEIVWECRPEKLDTINQTWSGAGSYRINFEENLYPSFFTVELRYEAGAMIGYKIVNKGSAQDEYKINLRDKSGKVLEEHKLSILPGKSLNLKLPASGRVKKISVEARSNPARLKEIKLN